MNNILLSVIVPVYNSAPFLVGALESLIESGADSAEFLIVDDGSTDSSVEILRRFSKVDSRFRIFTKKRGGPSSARNYALDRARGEYVVFLDADDRIKEGGYARLGEIIEKHSHPDLIVFGAELFPEGAPEYLRRLVSPRDRIYHHFTPEVLFSEAGARPFLWMQAMKRSIIEKHSLRMDEDISLGEDQLFQMAYIPKAERTVFVSERLYAYRWRSPASIMDRSEGRLSKKVMLHVDLIDRAFSLFERHGYGDKMSECLFNFSISFIYHDLIMLKSEEQYRCSSRLMEVFGRHRADKYRDTLDAWANARYRHIRILSISSPDERIEALKGERDRLRSEVSELKGTREYKRYMLLQGINQTLPAKVIRSLMNDGVRVTLSRIKRRLGI